MDSTLNDKLMEGQLASLDDEQFSNLARELGVNPSDPPASIKTFRAPLATIHRLANWRYVAFVGSLLAASIGVAAWWWSSSAHTAMMEPSAPAPLTQAALEAVAPKDAAPTAVALSSDLAQQLEPMTRDLAALRQAVEQLKVRQEQLARDNENVASQLKASQEEMARNNNIIEQIKATQIQMARESETVTERLNASQEQLAHVIANASEPKVMPEEPKVMPEIPVPRPRRSTNVAQTTPQQATARPQAKKPQTSLAWPWSVR
jgi:endonuclease/exonuclease/phosphatase (EEP) superfamily protein YafD